MKRIITGSMALGLLLQSGCATLASTPTLTPAPTNTPEPALVTNAEDIIGIWKAGVEFLQIKEDGTYRVASHVIANLEDSAQELGRFTLEGGVITWVTSDDSPICAGQSATYEARLTEQGELSFSPRGEDPCSMRAGALRATIYQPHSP